MKFKEFRAMVVRDIEEVKKVFEKRIGDSPLEVLEQMKEAEGWFFRFSYLLPYGLIFLERARKEKLEKKEKDKTELDREIGLEASVWEEKLTFKLIAGVLESLKERIEVCRTILSWEKVSLDVLKVGGGNGV